MFGELSDLGYGIIVFAIIIGVGTILLQKFTSATGCGTGTNGETLTFNESATSSATACYNVTGNTFATNGAGSATFYLRSQLGSSGLAGWVPAIIAFAVGMLFLGAFMINKGNRKY